MVEGLPALEALEGLLPGVDDVVVNEGCALTEGFPTFAELIKAFSTEFSGLY